MASKTGIKKRQCNRTQSFTEDQVPMKKPMLLVGRDLAGPFKVGSPVQNAMGKTVFKYNV